jgi:hypothetical protein
VTIIQSGTGSARLGRWVTRQALEFTIDCWNGLLDNHTCPTAGRRLKPGLPRRTVTGHQDAAAPLGKGEMTILKDMEDLDQEHDQCMQSLKNGGHSD